MHFRLLGPVEAWDDAGPVPIGALKQRHLLAALLFDGGHPTTFETLIDRLWGDAPPADARGALYGYVARLRRALRGDAGVGLDRWSGGYTLRVPAGSVDLDRFRALVKRSPADPAERLAALDEAFDLWRGCALAGLPGDWAARSREGLARARTTALADWATAALALGRPAAVIDRLTAAVAQDPLAEPVVALLMQALHRAGRTAEALDRYARIRALLADELGADPGQPLRDLHTELLRAKTPAPAPAAAQPRLGPCLLPPDLPDFTGHDDQVAAVHTALQPASTPLVAIVSGQGGAGRGDRLPALIGAG